MPVYNRTSRTYKPKPRRKIVTATTSKTQTRLKRRRNRRKTQGAIKGAEKRLKNFRQASILAVAITGLFLLFVSDGEAGLAQTDTMLTQAADSAALSPAEGKSGKDATVEAIGALQSLWITFLYYLPKLLIAAGLLLLAWLINWLLKKVLCRLIGSWSRRNAIISLFSIFVWLLAAGVALSVVAGDIRALVGSLGLIGLALSWSLQTPIESFTGWLLNSFKGYYRVGDRIKVGEVFGDVYQIDFLTTTVWEIGSPYQAGYVNAEQPTGRMVTFPNNEILTGTVTNLTGDFDYVWDELPVSIANESNLPKALKVIEAVALDLLGNYMVTPAQQYASLMRRSGLQDSVADKPQVYLSAEDSWTNLIIRYLVGARERRKWKSELIYRVNMELSKPEHKNIIIPVYPRQQLQFIDPAGFPVMPGAEAPETDS